jgi:hypothetical protein
VSVNNRRPHVFVLPEDRANSQLANGFLLEVDWARQRQIQILAEAGGWLKVLDGFQLTHVPKMDRYASRLIVLLIDFDRQENRLEYVRTRIPERLKDRVFVLGAWSEPEDLKKPLEALGSALARDCRQETYTTWEHDLLRHNTNELARLRQRVRPILF